MFCFCWLYVLTALSRLLCDDEHLKVCVEELRKTKKNNFFVCLLSSEYVNRENAIKINFSSFHWQIKTRKNLLKRIILIKIYDRKRMHCVNQLNLVASEKKVNDWRQIYIDYLVLFDWLQVMCEWFCVYNLVSTKRTNRNERKKNLSKHVIENCDEVCATNLIWEKKYNFD